MFAATPASSQIKVYASLPQAVTPSGLDMSNWVWVHCLTFPPETLVAQLFSLRPYKWLRYCIGAIIGAVGNLRAGLNISAEEVDYDAAAISTQPTGISVFLPHQQ
jgi:hypothetical protein